MDNNKSEEKTIDPSDPLGLKKLTGGLGDMAGFASNFALNVRSTLDAIKNNPDLTPEQKSEMEKKITDSDIEANLAKMGLELEKLKDLGKIK